MNSAATAISAPAMGRSPAALISSLKSDQCPEEWSLTEEAQAWAHARILSMLPASDEAEITAIMISAMSTCFPSVDAFDACAVSLHQWLCGLSGRETMLELSRIIDETSEVYHKALDFDPDIITEALEQALSDAADSAVARCTFDVGRFQPAFQCNVVIHNGALISEFITDGGERCHIVEYDIDQGQDDDADGIDDEVDPNAPQKISGELVPDIVKGHVLVSDTRIEGRKVTLTASIHDVRSNRIYGPLEVSDPKAVGMILHYRDKSWYVDCVIAKPVEDGRNPVIIRCTDPTC